MANSRALRVSTSNLVWALVVLVVGISGWIVGGWKWGLGGAVAVLVVSEIVERSARSRRRRLD